MIGYWVSFGLIALFVPIAIFFFLGWSASKLEHKPTKEQYARAGARGVFFTLFYWLCDLFYMACFLDNIVCKYIFGGLIIVVIITNLAKSFSSPKNKTAFDVFSMVQDFLIGIGLSIYLMFIIPSEEIKAIVIPVVAAIIGGLFTLTGVAWTIRKTDENRSIEELKDLRPIVFISNPNTIKNTIKPDSYWIVDKKNKGDVEICNPGERVYLFEEIQLVNSDNSYCTFRGFCINNYEYHWFDYGQTLNKGQYANFSLGNFYKFKEDIIELFLIFEDMRDNIYLMKVDFSLIDYDSQGTKKICIKSGYLPKKVEFNFGDEIIGEK